MGFHNCIMSYILSYHKIHKFQESVGLAVKNEPVKSCGFHQTVMKLINLHAKVHIELHWV